MDAEAQDPQHEPLVSTPEVMDLRALERDAEAAIRDRNAALRDAVETPPGQPPDAESLTRLLAARDRAAAALDRAEAALDRHRAAEYLLRVHRDNLTGALQRDAGRDQLLAEVDHCRRRGESAVLAFVDVDHLKVVNDNVGHGAGDDLLRAVGRSLRSGLRSYDVIVRYGGDEFVCLLSNTVMAAAEQRMAEVKQTLDGAVRGAKVSVGFAEFGPDETLDTAIARADDDLYARRARDPRYLSSSAYPGPVEGPQLRAVTDVVADLRGC